MCVHFVKGITSCEMDNVVNSTTRIVCDVVSLQSAIEQTSSPRVSSESYKEGLERIKQ